MQPAPRASISSTCPVHDARDRRARRPREALKGRSSPCEPRRRIEPDANAAGDGASASAARRQSPDLDQVALGLGDLSPPETVFDVQTTPT